MSRAEFPLRDPDRAGVVDARGRASRGRSGVGQQEASAKPGEKQLDPESEAGFGHSSGDSAVDTSGGRRDVSSTRGIIDRVTDPTAADETRIDRWLCAVRLVKTRPLATRLCEGGHVLVNGSPAKPSTKVRAGDQVEALIADRERVIEVVRPIESRVGAPAAATCYVDRSPPVVTEAEPGMMPIRGEGRPGKRLRRELERLRGADDA